MTEQEYQLFSMFNREIKQEQPKLFPKLEERKFVGSGEDVLFDENGKLIKESEHA